MGIRRGSLIVAAAIILAAAYLLYQPPTPASTQTTGPVNLTTEVNAAQCAPCHLQIGAAKMPGLIFDHAMHLMIACSACHYGNPHEDGKTVPPPMEACFNCHGIQHGPQGELARSQCSACHTRSFSLTPSSHVKGYAGKPHADQARASGVNDCLMCHNGAKDCDGCHAEQHVQVNGKPIGPMPKSYVPLAPPKVSKPAVLIYPDKPTTMGQCIYCHPDIDAFGKSEIIFSHAEHLRRDYKCTVCHPQFGHSGETIDKPSMETCYQCHDLTHSAGGQVATGDCSKCHPPGFQLKPANHTTAFVAGGHKDRASSDVAYCMMCHKSEFCVECHQGRKKMPDGTYSSVVLPADHKKADWTTKHGPLYTQQKGACGACHDSASCTTCHWTTMPHPTDWITTHGSVAHNIPEAKRDCNVCHTDRERCQACHHGSLKTKYLTYDACTPCHAEMKQQPATSIQNKAFAEHAVHFYVTDPSKPGHKDKPYQCDDCHVGYGTGQIQGLQTNLQQAAHNVELCYGCHGALDPVTNIQIAPYAGAALCLRCHQNLNI